ncbi:hypothetical protein V2U99_22480 [Klebsiella variicola]
MGCGLEDRGITDRYDACRYGWDEAMERIYVEVIPCAEEIAFPATDAFLAELQSQVIRNALNECTEYLDRDCIMESNGISYEDAALRETGAMTLQEALLRRGAAQ